MIESSPSGPEPLDDQGARFVEDVQQVIQEYGDAAAAAGSQEPLPDPVANNHLFRVVSPSLFGGPDNRQGDWWKAGDPDVQPGEAQLSIQPVTGRTGSGPFGGPIGTVQLSSAEQVHRPGDPGHIQDRAIDYTLVRAGDSLEVLRHTPGGVVADSAAGTLTRTKGTDKTIAGGKEVRALAALIDRQRRFGERHRVG